MSHYSQPGSTEDGETSLRRIRVADVLNADEGGVPAFLLPLPDHLLTEAYRVYLRDEATAAVRQARREEDANARRAGEPFLWDVGGPPPDVERPEELIHGGVWRQGNLAILAAERRKGKTTSVIGLVESFCLTGEWLGHRTSAPGRYKVGILDGEMDPPSLVELYRRMGAPAGSLHVAGFADAGCPDIMTDSGLAEVIEWVKDTGIQILVVDNLNTFARFTDSWREGEAYDLRDRLARLRVECGVVGVLLIAHMPKSGTAAAGSYGFEAIASPIIHLKHVGANGHTDFEIASRHGGHRKIEAQYDRATNRYVLRAPDPIKDDSLPLIERVYTKFSQRDSSATTYRGDGWHHRTEFIEQQHTKQRTAVRGALAALVLAGRLESRKAEGGEQLRLVSGGGETNVDQEP